MTDGGKQILDEWFSRGHDRDGNPTPACERGKYQVTLPETDADRRAEMPIVNGRHGAAEADSVPARFGWDGTASNPAAARLQDAAAVEDREASATTASYAAARLLEITTRNADAIVTDARARARQILDAAHAQAEQIIQARTAEAEAHEQSVKARVDAQHAELRQARDETLRELEARRAVLDQEVRQLTEFKIESRKDLISYFNEQLEKLH